MTKKTNTIKTYAAEYHVGAIQKKTWPVGITIPRWARDTNEDIAELAELVVGAQLEMTATVAGGDIAGQQTMPHADTVEPLAHIVTCASLSRITDSHISFRLSLPVAADPVQMAAFSFQSGNITLKRIGDRPTGAPDASDGEQEEDDE
jgi:hypothetical protein